jgi:hypothetical protein
MGCVMRFELANQAFAMVELKCKRPVSHLSHLCSEKKGSSNPLEQAPGLLRIQIGQDRLTGDRFLTL